MLASITVLCPNTSAFATFIDNHPCCTAVGTVAPATSAFDEDSLSTLSPLAVRQHQHTAELPAPIRIHAAARVAGQRIPYTRKECEQKTCPQKGLIRSSRLYRCSTCLRFAFDGRGSVPLSKKAVILHHCSIRSRITLPIAGLPGEILLRRMVIDLSGR